MPFSLKNTDATYQWIVNRMFKQQICQNMVVYVDNLLVKSKKADSHLMNLREAFLVLRRYQTKLNLAKCAFGVESKNFLGFMVSERGIKANLEKVESLD